MTDTLLLSDGRHLGYAEYGLPDGKLVLFMHGFGDSRLFGQLFDATARRTGAWLILLERHWNSMCGTFAISKALESGLAYYR